MNDFIPTLIRQLGKIYPQRNVDDSYEDFQTLIDITKKKNSYNIEIQRIIEDLTNEFPECYIEDRTTEDELDPAIRMHFYCKGRRNKIVFVVSLVSNLIGYYYLRDRFDSINNDENFEELQNSNSELSVYIGMAIKIIIKYFESHTLLDPKYYKLEVENLIYPFSGSNASKKVILFFLLFGDNIW